MFVVNWRYVVGARCALHGHATGCQPADVIRGLGSPLVERWNNPDYYWPAAWAALRMGDQ